MNLRPLLQKLHGTKEKLEAAARRIPDHHWRTPLREGAWSAAEIVAHVTMVATLLLDDRELMLSGLAAQRLRTLSVIESGGDSNLRKYRVQYPVLGSLHYYDWFPTLAAHDGRHTKHLHEIVKVRKNS